MQRSLSGWRRRSRQQGSNNVVEEGGKTVNEHGIALCAGANVPAECEACHAGFLLYVVGQYSIASSGLMQKFSRGEYQQQVAYSATRKTRICRDEGSEGFRQRRAWIPSG